MFKQKKDVADLFFFSQGDELLLQAEAGGVVDGAELDQGDQNLWQLSNSRNFAIEKHYLGRQCPSLNYSFLQLLNPPHALIAIPYTLFDASSMASASVGCAWIVHIRSSTVASSSIAATASAISSVACGPMMWTPRISP